MSLYRMKKEQNAQDTKNNKGIRTMSKLEIQEKDGKVFCPLINKWLIAKPEEKVRQRYICILVNDFGYSLEQMAQEVRVNNSQIRMTRNLPLLLLNARRKM